MNKEQQAQELDQLMRAVAYYSDPHEAAAFLTAAFEITAKAHEGVQRIDGQSYLHHPLAVAAILADWHAPVQVVAVGLLHDLLSPQYSRRYSSKEALMQRVHVELGADISQLLDEVVALNSFIRHVEGSDFYHQADTNDFWWGIAEYLQRASDAVLVKIADRLHNLRTCSVLTRSYQEQIASAGLHLLAPLVGRLGMGKVKYQVENHSFHINDQITYQLLQRRCVDPRFQQEIVGVVEEMQQALNELPELFRTPIVLYYFEEFSYKDIAEQMSVPLGTVMSRLARAKSFLRERLTDQADLFDKGESRREGS